MDRALTSSHGTAPVFGVGALRQALHTIGVRSLTLVSRVGLVVLITKSLSPADFGAYTVISTVGAFGVFLCGLNLFTYVYRAVPGLGVARQRQILKTTFTFEIGLTLAIVALVLASGQVGRILEYLQISEYRGSFTIGLAIIVSLVATSELTSFFQAQTRIQRANWVDFLGQASWVLPLIVLSLIGRKVGVTALLTAQLIAGAAVLLYGARHVGASEWWRARFDPSVLRSGLMFSVPLIVPTLGVSVVRFADRFFLSHYQSPAEVGVYAFAATFINTVYSFTAGVIFSTFGPRIFAAHNQGLETRRDLLQTYMLKAALFGFVVPYMLLCVLAKPLVAIVARPDYLPAVGVLPVIGLSSIMLIVGYPANYALMLQHRVKLLAAIDIVGMSVGLAANFLLIPRYSYYGAAIAGLLGLTVTCVLQYAFSGAHRHLQMASMLSLTEERRLAARFIARLRHRTGSKRSETSS